MKKLNSNLLLAIALISLMNVSKCEHPPLERDGIPPIDNKLETQRRESAKEFPQPKITKILRGSSVIWKTGDAAPLIKAGETLTLEGSGFGAGTHIDYSKVMVGKARALEIDLEMYRGHVDVKESHFFETDEVHDNWKKEVQTWNDNRILFKVPVTTNRGPIVVSVQKRIGANPSLTTANRAHSVWDPKSERVHGPFAHDSDVVSILSQAKLSNAVNVVIENKEYKNRVEEGGKIYWSYDYNIGSVHNAREMDWTAVLEGKATNPITGKKSNPEKDFGAIPITSSLSVPSYVKQKVEWNPYPIPNPLSSVIGQDTDFSGATETTGYVGYIYASSINPKTGVRGKWVGFSCASCHGQEITFPSQNGSSITKVFPGLPNHNWSMKWAVMSGFKGVKGKEEGISGDIDKSMMMYHVPNGAGEHSIVRSSIDKVSPYRNDFLFSPIAIPNVTTHTPLRRSLSHTEFYAGFEGSYIHSEEPDGAIGSMLADSLKSLTTYMNAMDKDDHLLQHLGIYRWLKENKLLSEVANVSEKTFIYSDKENYPILVSRLNRGEKIYQKNCVSCHANNFGTGSDENMLPLSQVGTYFSPTIFQKETQSIRTSMMTHMYWVQKRGLLHDTHVKSLEDLVNPDRCNSNSALYKKYYTMHSGSFKIPVGTEAQAKFTNAHAYFSRPSWDLSHYYWDYPRMLRDFGIKEFGKKVPLVSTPHPWCAENQSEVKDLVAYVLTL